MKIDALEQELAAGYRLGYKEALELASTASDEQLYALAHRLRTRYQGSKVETCSILNARSGRCSEDCKWCSQSRHHHTNVEVYPLVGEQEALREATHNASKGVQRFSLVTSGRTLSAADTAKICGIYRSLQEQVPIRLCASLGLLNFEQLKQLRESGVERYHCNLETAPSHFGALCTTHTPEEKIQTIRWARQTGMSICSGGIIGMGESEAQRIELAVALQGLEVDSIPVNVLNPIPGTALENTPPLSEREVLRAIALMRIVNPAASIRLAGGRTRIKALERKALHCGVSACITGDMLTTSGSDIDSDLAMFRTEGFDA